MLSLASHLLQTRLFKLQMVAQYLLLCLVFAHFVFGASVEITICAALSIFLVALLRKFIEEQVVLFFLAHPTWMFFLTIYIYATFNLKLVDAGLFDVGRSSLIVLVVQFALFVSALIYKVVGFDFSRNLPPNSRPISFSVFWLDVAFIAVGAVSTLASAIFYTADHASANPLDALTSQLFPLMILSVIYRYLKNGTWVSDPWILLAIASIVISVFLRSERTPILLLGLAVVILILASAPKILDLKRIVLAVLIINLVSVFSDLAVYSRIAGGRTSIQDTAATFVERAVSIDTLASIVLFQPSSLKEETKYFTTGVAPGDFYQINYFEEHGLAERFTLLPFLDVVVPQLPLQSGVDWSQLRKNFLTVLPNFGQEKELYYGDKVLYMTGIRQYLDHTNVSQPMLTGAGEFFAIGGYALLFSAYAFFGGVILFGAHFLRKIIGNDVIFAVSFMLLTFKVVFTSTSTSIMSAAVRGIPSFLVVLLVVVYFQKIRIK